MPHADLHMHTTFSDGQLTPEALAQKVKQRQIEVFAVTDHDTIAGWDEVQAAAAAHGLTTVPGVELSVHVGDREVHLLGYGFAPGDAGLQAHLAHMVEVRKERMHEIVDRLNNIDIRIDTERVAAIAGSDAAFGRPHVAQALVEHGAVPTFDEAFERYIGRGQPAYVAKPKTPADKVLAVLHDAGGIGVLAHPGQWMSGTLLRRLIRAGLDGIEVDHPSHTDALQAYYRRLADDFGLLQTGGSDYHGHHTNGEKRLGAYGLSRRQWGRLADEAGLTAAP